MLRELFPVESECRSAGSSLETVALCRLLSDTPTYAQLWALAQQPLWCRQALRLLASLRFQRLFSAAFCVTGKTVMRVNGLWALCSALELLYLSFIAALGSRFHCASAQFIDGTQKLEDIVSWRLRKGWSEAGVSDTKGLPRAGAQAGWKRRWAGAAGA